jgi:hypothetical protein
MATTDDVRARFPLRYRHVFFLANEQPSQVYAYSRCFLSATYHMEITGNSISCVAFGFFFLGGGGGGGVVAITGLTLLFFTNSVSPHHLEKMQEVMHLKL